MASLLMAYCVPTLPSPGRGKVAVTPLRLAKTAAKSGQLVPILNLTSGGAGRFPWDRLGIDENEMNDLRPRVLGLRELHGAE